MPTFLKNLGLEVFAEDEEIYSKLVGHVLSEGKAITGYTGLPYINHHLGWAQLIARVNQMEDKKLAFTGLDTHCAGICFWDVRISSIIKDLDNDDPLSKVLVVKGMDGRSMAAVHVVNADVLPSFAEDEVIRLQMIAFPEEISYYSDAQAYDATIEPDKFGRKIALGENCLFPIGIFSESDRVPVKTLTQIRGVVKRLLWGEVKLGDDTINPFIDCIVDTQMGDIEILHTIEAVEESQRDNLKIGATVNCLCYLSGDPAIGEYDHGIVLDHEHHLKLLAYTLAEGDPERLRCVLADDFIYESEATKKRIDNPDEYIEFVKFVQAEGETCHPHYATITQSPEDGDHPVETRCLVLSYGASEEFNSMVFIIMNADDKIQRIHVSKDSRYRFKVDDPLPEPVLPEDMRGAQSTLEAILWRANFDCLLPEGTDEAAIEACIEQHRDAFAAEADRLANEEKMEHAFAEAMEFGIRMRGQIRCDPYLVEDVAIPFIKDHRRMTNDDDDPRAALVQSLLYVAAIGYLCENDIPFRDDDDEPATEE